MRPLVLALAITSALSAQDRPETTLKVSAIMDIWRAGGYNDNSDGIPPAAYRFRARSGQTIIFSSVNGTWACGNTTPYGPDGSTTTICEPHNIDNPIGPFSGYDTTDFVGGMVGVFLEDKLPIAAPPPLRFYVSNNSQGGTPTDFASISPLIGQIFFIGDGLTGTGTGSTQVFHVPPTATHLYLGYVDSCNNTVPSCYYNNVGVLTATLVLRR